MLDYITYLISCNSGIEIYEGNIGILCTLAGFPHIRQFLKYNGNLDQFEIPISKLEENNIKVNPERIVYPLGNRSEILCYTDKQNNLCFGIKTDWE